MASCCHCACLRVLSPASMPGLAPAGDLLFFASPKKPKEKKGDPQSGPLRGSLKKLKEPENLETSQLRCRRTSRFFNPSPSAFSSPARTGWVKEGSPSPNSRLPPVLAEPSSAGCPQRSVGTQAAGRLFFCLLCFWRSKRKVSCCRATPGMLARCTSFTTT